MKGKKLPEDEYFYAYNDGVRSVIDDWDDALENSDGRTEAFEEFKKRIEDRRKEIESL